MAGLTNRDAIIAKLHEEIIGPAANGSKLDCTKPTVFDNFERAYQPFVQAESGEEILQRDAPLNRYGAGILYPLQKIEKGKVTVDSHPASEFVLKDANVNLELEEIITQQSKENDEPNKNDGEYLNLVAANQRLPSSMAISFLAELHPESRIVVSASGGRYHKLPVTIQKQAKIWWRRESVKLTGECSNSDFPSNTGKTKVDNTETQNTKGLDLSIEVFIRSTQKSNRCLITVVLVNRTAVTKGLTRDECALFQAKFDVCVFSSKGKRNILPYPQTENSQLNDEEESIELLYRRAQTFAVGHGCSADWDVEIGEDERVEQVSATSFPIFEVPNITSDIRRADGTPLEISMAKLAGLISRDDGMQDLAMMIDEYGSWIESQERDIRNLSQRYRRAASKHLQDCRKVFARMNDGLNFLREDEKALAAFRLANHAILIQQHQSKRPLRGAARDKQREEICFSENYFEPDWLDLNSSLGKWRGFQIAFLLVSLRSAIDPDCAERETVELIWFPTGGGKTEAYLGLIAFTLIYRRLKNPVDAGTHVFMRYTLRLLTAQQFQRTAALTCAMEYLRRRNETKMGKAEFSIALWLGNEVTPGTRKDAVQILKNLKSNQHAAENKFILNRCPWCAAQIGKVEGHKGKGQHSSRASYVIGYEERGGSVRFHCPDKNCEFHRNLPVYVVDEDIYERPPSVFIATVDKFAVLAWKPEARALFGFDKNGNRIFSPPGLIIQDELHLISGPLGSMVGLYEAVVEELCTDYRFGKPARPKIISSTATTRRYQEQIKALFARNETQLFPPPGLEAGDSFFARYARDRQGKLLSGRKYVGINAPGLGSLQNAEVRTYTALLQAPFGFPLGERDAYWTLFIFYNNLKMLGNAISLFQANIPAYFLTYKSRTRQSKIRRIKQPLELTGRLRSDEVPAALRKLEINWNGHESKAVDVCLASSIAEVGMDISRLSQMAVVGQPKTTAQYIQITGRVGRDASNPGLIVTIYSSSKARDRSHFERFRTFHEKLYAQVEPMSVTPFSPPALVRALHAVIVAFVRQTGTRRQAALPFPFPAREIARFKEKFLARLMQIAPDMRREFEKIFNRRMDEWQHWERTRWTGELATGNNADALLRPFEKWTDETNERYSWATPVSMRSVGAEAEFRVTHYYQSADAVTQNKQAEK